MKAPSLKFPEGIPSAPSSKPLTLHAGKFKLVDNSGFEFWDLKFGALYNHEDIYQK